MDTLKAFSVSLCLCGEDFERGWPTLILRATW